MRSRGVEIHGLLLVAALVAAWVSWTDEDGPPQGAGEVTMWDLGGEEAVTAVRWVAKGRTAELERKATAGAEPYVWGRTERERQARPASQPTSQPSSQPAASAAPAPPAATSEGEGEGEGEEAPVEIDKKVFLANARAAEVMVSLAKPVAKRSLGRPSPEQLAELQLNDPEGVITVTAGSATQTLEVGMMAYGGGLRYVRNPTTDVAYVVAAKIVDDLKWADSRLVERDLHAFKSDDVQTFSVTARGATKAFTRGKDDTAVAWLGKLFRLRADRYVGPDESLHEGDAELPEVELLKAEFQTAQGQAGHLRLTRFGEGAKARWYARSERTQGRVGVSRYQADEVSKDLDGLFPEESTPTGD